MKEGVENLIDKMLPALGLPDDPLLRYKARVIIRKNMPKYKESQSQFPTFIWNQLQQLRREYFKQVREISYPERYLLLSNQINKFKNSFMELNGREPSDEEIADYFKISIPFLKKLEQIKKGLFITETETLPIYKTRTQEELLVDAFYQDLSDIDKVIFKYKTGYRQSPILSTHEIAHRLGMTPSAVSQRAKNLSDRLNQLMEETKNVGR